MNKSKGNSSRRSEPQKGRRYTAEQKQHALLLVATGMNRTDVGKAVGAIQAFAHSQCAVV